MGMLDFLKVTVTEKVPAPKYTATLTIDGKTSRVNNLGTASVSIVEAGHLKVGQAVNFALDLSDPKERLAFTGRGQVESVDKSGAKIAFVGLPPERRQQVAKFLARYMINR